MTIIDDYKAGKRDFSGADLSNAYLNSANLSGADLSNAYLRGANLSGADLSNAYLNSAYLSNAYLNGADLSGADLSGAYLSGANLRGANLRGARLPAFQIPQEGELFVWKKLQKDVLAKCIVPREAKRTASLAGRKCRAEMLYVLEIIGATVGTSQHDNTTQYKVGGWVHPDMYDDDIRVECASGLHFFLTREEAEDYI